MHRYLLAAAALLLSSTLTQAHPGGPIHDLTHGFMHPLGGFDHILAMIAVGLLAAQLGGRALWLVPAAFLTTMAIAAVVGMSGGPIVGTEFGIALSVLVLGAVVAASVGMPTSIAMAMVAVLAVFHGYAHGTEMPATISGFEYGLGFVAASALLHAVGIGFGLLMGKFANGGSALRLVGGAIAVAGVALMVGGS